MRRAMMFVAAFLVCFVVLIVPSPATCQNEGKVSCGDIKTICRQFADIQFYGCTAKGYGWLGCYLDSEDAYQLCVTERSNGQCSIFH